MGESIRRNPFGSRRRVTVVYLFINDLSPSRQYDLISSLSPEGCTFWGLGDRFEFFCLPWRKFCIWCGPCSTDWAAARKLLLRQLPEDFYCTLLSIDLFFFFLGGIEDKIMRFNNGRKQGQERRDILALFFVCEGGLSQIWSSVKHNEHRWKRSVMKAFFFIKIQYAQVESSQWKMHY